MATLEETQKQLDDAKKRVTTITEQLKTPASAAVRSSLKAQLTAADKEVKRLEKAIKPLEEAAKQAVKDAEAAVTAANLSAQQVQIGITQRKSALDASSRAYQRDPANDDKWAKFQKDAQNLYDYEQSAIATGSSIIPSITLSAGTYSIGTPPAATPTGATPTVSATNIPGPTVRLGVGRRAATTTATTPTEETSTPTETTPPETTPTGGTGAVTAPTKGKGKKPKPVVGVGPLNIPQAVRDEFLKQFPQYAANFDMGTKEQQFVDFFGKDLIDIWVKQLDPTTAYDLTNDTEKAAYLRDVENTAYGQRTSANEQNFDFNPAGQAELIRIKKNEITKQYGDLQLSVPQLEAVAREAARKNYTGEDLQFAVYTFAYQAVPATTVMETEMADKLRNAGRAYGYTPTDAEIKAALTNTAYNGMMVTEDTIREKAQRAAKGQYKHLSEQIDAGLSLEDIFYNYKSYAARVLQVDPSEIDFINDPKWAEAFGNDKTGQLSLNDWTYKLKSDDRYGYQFTDTAKQQATNLVMGLEKAFGFTR